MIYIYVRLVMMQLGTIYLAPVYIFGSPSLSKEACRPPHPPTHPSPPVVFSMNDGSSDSFVHPCRKFCTCNPKPAWISSLRSYLALSFLCVCCPCINPDTTPQRGGLFYELKCKSWQALQRSQAEVGIGVVCLFLIQACLMCSVTAAVFTPRDVNDYICYRAARECLALLSFCTVKAFENLSRNECFPFQPHTDSFKTQDCAER